MYFKIFLRKLPRRVDHTCTYGGKPLLKIIFRLLCIQKSCCTTKKRQGTHLGIAFTMAWDPIIQQEVYSDDGGGEEHDAVGSFQDSEAFLAALELYNRDGCKLQEGIIPMISVGNSKKQRVLKQLVPSRLSKCREVAGRHTKPCDECGRHFEYPCSSSTYYLTEEWSKVNRYSSRYDEEGEEHNTKLCLPCMDRILSDKYETTDLSEIKEKLAIKRREHSGYKDGLFDIKEYEKEYPNYPVFLRHLRRNDKEKGERVQLEMMRGVSAAMSRATW
jgi:hypothetical protein